MSPLVARFKEMSASKRREHDEDKDGHGIADESDSERSGGDARGRPEEHDEASTADDATMPAMPRVKFNSIPGSIQFQPN